MNNVLSNRFVVGAALGVSAGALLFAGVSLAGSGSNGSATATTTTTTTASYDRGAIGLDVDCPAVTCPDFGIIESLNKPAPVKLTDDKVIVVASQCSADATPHPGTCTSVQSDDENTTRCPSTWGNNQLPSAPTAASGFACVYVLGGENLGTIIGTGAIHGSSIAPGTNGSKLGFKIGWNPDNAGDSYVDAVWAYKS